MFGNGAVMGQGASDNQAPIVGTLTYNNVTQSSVDLSCLAVDNVAVKSYKIFLDGVLNMVVKQTELSNYSVGGLAAGTPYDIYVTAVDYTGNESDPSNTISFTTVDDVVNSYIYLTTTSTSSTWSPSSVVNTGDTLLWSVTGGVTIAEQAINDPTLDLSSNVGTAVVTVRSTSGFAGLSTFNLDNLNLINVSWSAAVDIEVAEAKNEAGLSAIDISALTKLRLFAGRTSSIASLDTSANIDLESLWMYQTPLTTLDITNNTKLTLLRIDNSNFTTAALEDIIIKLDSHGLSNGSLQIAGNAGITSNVYNEYSALTAKGWFIDVANPGPPAGNPTGTSPKIYYFRVENAEPSRIYFDSTQELTGSTVTGVELGGAARTVTGVTINPNSLTGHYFTVSSPFDFWDNTVIRYDGGADIQNENTDILLPFDLQYVHNLIAEPAASAIRYASVSGTGSRTGLDPANAWTYQEAADNAQPGQTVRMLAGESNVNMTISVDGTPTAPIIFEGYNNQGTPVERTRTPGMTFDSTIMPHINSAHLFLDDRQNLIFKNIQVSRNVTNSSATKCIFMDDSTNIVFHNTYTEEGRWGFFCFRNHDGLRHRVTRCYGANMDQGSIHLASDYSLIEDFYACSSKENPENDYFINIYGTTNGYSSIIRNCYVERFPGTQHAGHGISIKADEHSPTGYGTKREWDLVEDCIIKNVGGAAVELRHHEVQHSVVRNVDMSVPGVINDNSWVGVQFTSAQHCIVDSCSFDCEIGVRFLESTEDPDAVDAGNNNLIKNCLFTNVTVGTGPVIWGNYGQGLLPNNNTLVNCTIDGFSGMSWSSFAGEGINNRYINCIIKDIPSNNTSGADIGWTYENCNFDGCGTWANAEIGSNNNIGVDSQLSAGYQPSNEALRIGQTILKYDRGGNQRYSNTTLGMLNLATEVANAPLTPIMTNFRVVDSTPDRVYFDTPLGSVDGIAFADFTINGKTITGVDTTNNYFTVSSAFTYWEKGYTIKKTTDTIVYGFTMTYIDNQIVEPAASGVVRYVSPTGSDGNGGTGTGDAWATLTYADDQTSAGAIIYVEAGVYVEDPSAFSSSGTISNPKKWIGYKSVVNDITSMYYNDYDTDSIDTAEMPTIVGSGQTDSNYGFQVTGQYHIFKNFQATGFDQHFIASSGNVVFERCIAYDSVDETFHSKVRGFNTGGSNASVIDCRVKNMARSAFYHGGSFNLIKDCKAWCDNTVSVNQSMDYYYGIYNASNNVIKDCYGRRTNNSVPHGGHSCSVESDAGWGVTTDNLIDGLESVNVRAIEWRAWSEDNVAKNVNHYPAPGDTGARGVYDRDGNRNNILENSRIEVSGGQEGIFYWNTSEGWNGLADSNIYRNNIFVGNGAVFLEINDQNGGNPSLVSNKYYNNTIEGFGTLITVTGSPSIAGNEFKGNLIDATSLGNGSGFSFDYNNFTGGIGTQGTNSSTVSPNFVDTVDYEPQAISLIVLPKITGVNYDRVGNERAAVTTLGQYKNNSEIITV